MKKVYYFILLIGFFSSCTRITWGTKKADTIFYGGDILTIEESYPTAEAVAVAAGKIIFVGSKEEALVYKGKNTEVIDLQGKTLLPGFIDAHTHILPTALMLEGLQLDPFTYRTGTAVLEKIKEELKKGPVLAFRYDPSLMTDPIDLNFNTLDTLSATVPILVINNSGHIAYGNRAAFQKALINNSNPNPIGSSFERDQAGNLTGVAYELPAVALLISAFPQKQQLDFKQLTKKAADYYAEHGYTTVTDLALGLPMPNPLENIEILRQVAHDPDTPIRIQGYIVYPLMDYLQTLQQRNDARFQVLGVKIWSDGSLQGHTGALLQPYKDLPSSRGVLNYTPTELDAMVLKAHKQGFQVAVHANGDAAIKDTLNAFGQALEAHPTADPRFRLEHATLLDRATLLQMKNVKASPSFTVLHIYRWGEVFQDTILGVPRANEIDSARSAKELGLKFSINDDALAELDPLLFLQIIVTRQMRNGAVLNPKETISVGDALKAMTLYPAWQSFREKELGSITLGKYADFVLLNKNPTKVDPHTLKDIQIVATWVNGKRVFPKKPL